MYFDVFTLFPEVFQPYINTSIIQRAVRNQVIKINLFNIRDWATDKHHTTDDTPFGGGGGMVMKPEPIFSAVEAIEGNPPGCPVILMSPQGSLLTFKKATELNQQTRLAILCGRYEGIDERVIEHLVDEEISIGDYVLSGGELPALVLIEALTRLLPGALGDPDGAADDSFSNGLLEYPQYTRPSEFRGWKVPDILQNGNHKAINRWRRKQTLKSTLIKRPDLLNSEIITSQDRELFEEIEEGQVPLDLIKKIMTKNQKN
jgi:tRNA (guanine37-N1)-methyltransferase